MQDSISSKFSYAVKADISRFFYTVYNHSLPRAVLGKNKAKKSYRLGWFKRHWSNQIDLALQACQSRETFGIPIGPDTSRIISEILMSGIESEDEFLKNLDLTKAVRLIDDIYIGENTKHEAESALERVTSALWMYNLQLNEEKTYISETKYFYDDYWKRDFDELKFNHRIKESDKKRIKRIVDAALYHCESERSERPAIWACRRLISISKSIEDDVSLTDAFFRLGRDYPSTTKHVAEFLVNNRSRLSRPEIEQRVQHWIKNLIKLNYGSKNDMELSWALLISGIYQIVLKKDDIPNFENVPSSVVFSIFGLLRQHGLSNVPLSLWNWRPRFKKSGIHGTDWLPLYEAVLRKWTKDAKLVALVKSCPHFSKLLADEITFLDDSILKITKIDFKRRKLGFMTAPTNLDQRSNQEIANWFKRVPYDL